MSRKTPISLRLQGDLADVLGSSSSGEIAEESAVAVPGTIQTLRFTCGSSAYCRLVDIVLEVLGKDQSPWVATPQGPTDEIRITRDVEGQATIRLSLRKKPEVDASTLPNPFPSIAVLVEALG